MKHPNEWSLWGDRSEPFLEGTEQEVKDEYDRLVTQDPNYEDTLYITDPDGNDYTYEPGEGWTEA